MSSTGNSPAWFLFKPAVNQECGDASGQQSQSRGFRHRRSEESLVIATGIEVITHDVAAGDTLSISERERGVAAAIVNKPMEAAAAAGIIITHNVIAGDSFSQNLPCTRKAQGVNATGIAEIAKKPSVEALVGKVIAHDVTAGDARSDSLH